jgi:hypothetical protein
VEVEPAAAGLVEVGCAEADAVAVGRVAEESDGRFAEACG